MNENDDEMYVYPADGHYVFVSCEEAQTIWRNVRLNRSDLYRILNFIDLNLHGLPINNTITTSL